ncbi:transcription factor PAR2-like [Salvia miltiorrhiza]|uniref:transcription factor PAR2-like n=1 Tax=Salvia miltiorrhiza TaxID=226208 RepID=UPI0025AD4ECF|nr:transcription factor PAR2-like [Salvia miltiorrhiza]XP_057796142.1 transcription factor PAR2-like [Salvia miltiorrhiza]
MNTQTTAAQHPSSAAALRLRSTRNHTKSAHGDEEADDKAEVEKKIVALQKIVPGGEKLPVEELFQETAEYIFALESQVEALRFLAAFVQTSQKRKRKLGG